MREDANRVVLAKCFKEFLPIAAVGPQCGKLCGSDIDGLFEFVLAVDSTA